MTGLDDLREQGRMTWVDEEHGWVAALEDVVTALTNGGFTECKREVTTSRRDLRPAGGVWQGLNIHTGSVASAIWRNRSAWPHAIVFITVDGVSFRGPPAPSTDGDPYREDGGEG